MEKSKATITSVERPSVKDWLPNHCSFLWFGNDESAKRDMKNRFEIKEDK